jgi:cytochrome P450
MQVIGLILGGSDTTLAGIAITLSLLLQHPDQWAAVKADPALIPGAVTEALRHEPPTGSLPRFCAKTFEVDGITIPAGVLVALSTLSAMRDEDVLADPDRFDITRADGPRLHMVFGGGPHRCLGETLARLEMEEALAAVIATAPGIELIEPARTEGYGGIRKVTPMMVRVGS